MSSELEERKCHCGKKLRAGSQFKTCAQHRTQEEQREAWRVAEARKRLNNGATPRVPKPEADDETSVLDRLGFGQGSDEHPAEKRVKPPPKGARRPSVPELPTPSWQAQFRQLATALGLEPDSMLEAYCRNWVESTRARALNTMPFSVANGATAAAEEPAPIAADSSVSA